MVTPLVSRLRWLVVIVSILLSAIRYPLSAAFADTPQEIRVLILQDADSFNLRVKGPYKITDYAAKKCFATGSNLNTTVTAYNEGIILGGEGFSVDRLRFVPADSQETIINGRRFRGQMGFIKDRNNRLAIVNHIGLEDYIRGILYHEVSHYWPMEALNAQAIACRSYAAYQKELNKAKDYDLTSDMYSQVYGGRTSERYRSSIAVDKTRGLIIAYKGKPLAAFFHATCAGHTEDASLLWNIDLAPLKGVKCDFCKKSPHYKWDCVLPLREFRDKLNKAGYALKDVQDIAIAGRDASGRVTDLEVKTLAGLVKIPADKLRIILGPNMIRSANFTAVPLGSDVVFEGLGWGHGVGMCQWGAYFMAKEGYNYKDILAYYYPGTKIQSINKAQDASF
ncbi:MAG: SpoIID/LytB domain-containing protein [Candidatus Omnitrophica bacterium]|nr:SpoIID/LytB domain-containing protein [Candidatus Omnitrophota bacterium]MBL7151382.1 SpoIID/LytB domain-containing protein [Candidatus Omnitrophota bacterium]MBL7210263.1 SpoIID/LytB domain-containing protein [Candidatus Omnitrophota bacterium]